MDMSVSVRSGFGPALVALALVAAADARAEVDFQRDIQPLLARRCLACHGPDEMEAGLRLDSRAAATAELDGGTRAIVAGDPNASELLARVVSTDPDVRMPPHGEALTPAQVEKLRAWIAAGADWPEHWAFRPVARPDVPEGGGGSRRGNPIDDFIAAGLARRGLPRPAPADKAALLRRATYSVTGLPPTEAEVRDFLADESPGAWEKVVDRLLASPHYGEHWARHWLDLVRYADTNSFERDGVKPHAWRYRDYVIRAFNDDKPYDRFIVEQVAGDELPDPTPDALVATGWYRLGLWDDEPADRLQARYDWLDDLVSTTGQTFLGLTIACARCHDHKIDPLTQRDYYALLSFFQNITPMANGGPAIERPIFADEAARRDHEVRSADLKRRRDEARQAVAEIEGRFRREWEKLRGGDAGGGDLDEVEFRFYRDTWTSLPNFDELKPEDVGAVPENAFDITVAPSLRPDSFGYVFTGFLRVPEEGEYTFTLDSDDGARLTVDGRTVVEYDGIHGEGDPRKATVRLPAGRLPIRVDYFQWLHGKGLSVAWSGPGFASRSLSATRTRKREFNIAAALKADGERILGAEGLADFKAKVAAAERLKREEVPVEEALIVTEHGTEAPQTFVLFRGNPHAETKPEHRVEPGFPQVLHAPAPEIAAVPAANSTGRRTALARWLVSTDNPLTARVMVNRVWQYHFGRGLVRSSSNFGLMGDAPTHPELLDWLTSEFVAGGWRLKSLHKLILMSEAFRATSTGDATAATKDPLNDAFWRFDPRRLSAEELRDSIHVASGAFNPKMYGPGVFPDIPAEVKAGQSRPGAGWGNSPPEEQARRSVYIHVKRSLLTPILADYDLADTDTPCPVRFTTTQPTQALGMMNGSFLQAQARVLAARARREALAAAEQPGAADDDTAKIVRRALEIVLVRPATDAEVTRGVALVDRLEDTDGVSPGRALELYCLMVLNLNEFAYLD